jgi:hypothetical protein
MNIGGQVAEVTLAAVVDGGNGSPVREGARRDGSWGLGPESEAARLALGA